MKSNIPGWQTARRALDVIPDMENARVLGLVSDGPGNRSYQVENQGKSYVLRLDKPAATWLGLDRDNEKLVSQVVADAGLAPAPLFFDPQLGISFRRFLPGRSWVASDLESEENLAGLGLLLRRLHALAPVGESFKPEAAARRYADQLGTQESGAVFGELEKLAARISAGSPRQAICHNDLVCQNIFDGEHLMLIDWEYAGIGDPFFDLAVVVEHHDLSQDQATGLLASYLQHAPTGVEIAHLDLQCEFYAHLLTLWNQINPIADVIGIR